MRKRGGRRLGFALTFSLLLLTEVLIALFVRDAFIRPYLGDVLAVITLWALVRIWIPDGARLLPLGVTAAALAVEFLQYIHILRRLGLGENPFFRILLGSVFDWADVLCYLVGGSLAAVAEAVMRKARNREYG